MRFIVFILRPKAAIGGNCVHERMRPEAEGLATKYRDRVLGLLSFLLVTTYLDCAYISVAEPRIYSVHPAALWPSQWSTPRNLLHGPTACRYW